MSKNLLARIAVAAVCIPIILWICYQDVAWLFGMVAVFALFGMAEFLINEGHKPSGPIFWLTELAVAALLTGSSGILGCPVNFVPDDWASNPTGYTVLLAPLVHTAAILLVYFVLSAMLFAIGKRPPAELFKTHSRLMWGLLYIGLLYQFVFVLGLLPWEEFHPVGHGDALLFLFGLLWVGDTAAMFTGKYLGRHKLAPAVSPNKTVEGFIGGVIGALVIGVIMYFWKLQSIPIHHVLLIALGCSVFGQLGDLVESMWKRSLGVKDSSAIIPGHGGVLDRFDSLLFAAPFMVIYIAFILMP